MNVGRAKLEPKNPGKERTDIQGNPPQNLIEETVIECGLPQLLTAEVSIFH